MKYNLNEFLICSVARILLGSKHVAVGMASPIAASAALMLREENKDKKDKLRVSIIGGEANNPFTDGGRELFDCTGQGRIDTFFLGGVQIDGQANINLIGMGKYPSMNKRFPGTFGAAYMYFMVPRVILFRQEHSRRVFVPKVDFVSAPGFSGKGVYRTGGPFALVTELCIMMFDKNLRKFQLISLHPGHTLEEVKDNTGFDFIIPNDIPMTKIPEISRLKLLRSVISKEISKTYPKFVSEVFGNK